MGRQYVEAWFLVILLSNRVDFTADTTGAGRTIHVSHLAYTNSGWTGVFSVTQQFVYLVLSLPQSDVSLVYCLIRYHRYNCTFDNFFLEFLLPICGLLFLTFMPYTYAVAVLSFCPLILKVRCLWTNTHISSLSIALLSSFGHFSMIFANLLRRQASFIVPPCICIQVFCFMLHFDCKLILQGPFFKFWFR